MKTFSWIPAPAIALSLLTVAVAGCHAQTPPESTADKAFGAKVRAYLLAHPEVIDEAVEKLQAREAAAKEASARVAVIPGMVGSAIPRVRSPWWNSSTTAARTARRRSPICKSSWPLIPMCGWC
jgi:hypothetical protein